MKVGRRGNSQREGMEDHQNNFELHSFTISNRMLENGTDGLQPDEIHLSRNYPQHSHRINEDLSGSCDGQLTINLPPQNHLGFRGFLGRIKGTRKTNDSESCNR